MNQHTMSWRLGWLVSLFQACVSTHTLNHTLEKGQQVSQNVMTLCAHSLIYILFLICINNNQTINLCTGMKAVRSLVIELFPFESNTKEMHYIQVAACKLIIWVYFSSTSTLLMSVATMQSALLLSSCISLSVLLHLSVCMFVFVFIISLLVW